MADTDFGTDVGGVTDVDPVGKLVAGRLLLGQAIARRYITPRGRLVDDPNYGEDLTEHINDDMTAADLAAMQTSASREAEKDERVVSAAAVAVLSPDGEVALTVTITDSAGPFKLRLSVSDVSVALLSVGN